MIPAFHSHKPTQFPAPKQSNIQRDLKSYLVKKSAEMLAFKMDEKKKKRDAQELQFGEVEVIKSSFEGKSYNISVFFVFINFAMSLAIEFKELDKENEEENEVKDKLLEDKDKVGYYPYPGMLQSNTMSNTLQSFSANPTIPAQQQQQQMLQQELPILQLNQLPLLHQQSSGTDNKNSSVKISPYLAPLLQSQQALQLQKQQSQQQLQTHTKRLNSFQQNPIPQYPHVSNYLINEEGEEDLLKLLTLIWTGLQIQGNSLANLGDCLASSDNQLCYKCTQIMNDYISNIKLEFNTIIEEINKKIFSSKSLSQEFILKFSLNDSSNLNVNTDDQNTISYFSVAEIKDSLSTYIKMNQLSQFIVVSNHLHTQFKIMSIKPSILILLYSCIQLIVDSSHEIKIKSKFQYTSYLSSQVNNKRIIIQFLQLFASQQSASQPSDCAIGIRFNNLPNSQLLDSYSHSKQSALFYQIIKTHLEKVGVVSSLKLTQNTDKPRFTLSFILNVDCSVKNSTNRHPIRGGQNNNNYKVKIGGFGEQIGSSNNTIIKNMHSSQEKGKSHLDFIDSVWANQQYNLQQQQQQQLQAYRLQSQKQIIEKLEQDMQKQEENEISFSNDKKEFSKLEDLDKMEEMLFQQDITSANKIPKPQNKKLFVTSKSANHSIQETDKCLKEINFPSILNLLESPQNSQSCRQQTNRSLQSAHQDKNIPESTPK